MQRIKAIVLLFSVACLFGLSERHAHPVQAKLSPGPPLGFTGAPGEGSCVGCHYTHGGSNGVPNLGPGRIEITGLPAFYTPGQTYAVTLTIIANLPSVQRWGFELTVLDASGDSLGAGELSVTDAQRVLKRSAAFADRTRVYLSHNDEAGTNLGRTGRNSWTFNWLAPNSNTGELTFYGAGNAADGQVTPEGDYIYTTLARVRPPALVVVTQALVGLSSYLKDSAVAGFELHAYGNFDAQAKLIFNNVELPTQMVADGLVASLSVSQVGSFGVYPVRVRLGNGELSNSLNFIVANQLNSQSVAVVEAAAYARLVAPGQLAALFGVALTNNEAVATANVLPLPRVLQNTSVYVNGVSAPLFFASNGQLNFQVPFSTAVGLATVVVLRADGTAAQGSVNVHAAAPALFTANASGRGQAVALNADFTLNGDPAASPAAKRAAKGSYVVLFGTGTGAQLSEWPSDGVAANSNPLITTTSPPTVTIGGRPTLVTFSGFVPGLVGLWQLNVRIPNDVPGGRNVEVVINWGQRDSSPVTLAIE